MYIGVYTAGQLPSSFSILVTKQLGFSPILLMNGQNQAGSVEP